MPEAPFTERVVDAVMARLIPMAEEVVRQGAAPTAISGKDTIKADLQDSLGLAYELGYSEKWMRRTVDEIIKEIKRTEGWDGRKD